MASRSVYVRMRPDEVEALVRLALAERRRPSDQAAVLLAEALKRAQQSGESQDAQPRRPAEAGAAT
jgi:hypothetical protein